MLLVVLLLQAAWWVTTRVERFQIRQPLEMSVLNLLVFMRMWAA